MFVGVSPPCGTPGCTSTAYQSSDRRLEVRAVGFARRHCRTAGLRSSSQIQPVCSPSRSATSTSVRSSACWTSRRAVQRLGDRVEDMELADLPRTVLLEPPRPLLAAHVAQRVLPPTGYPATLPVLRWSQAAHQPRWTREARISFSQCSPAGESPVSTDCGRRPLVPHTTASMRSRASATESRVPVVAGADRFAGLRPPSARPGWSRIRPARICVTATPLISWHPAFVVLSYLIYRASGPDC